jgi:myo-inositol-1(or 4)-monophosphatase
VASDRRPESLEPRYANFKSMLAQATEGGKHVHGIRMLGASVGSFTALALGQTDVYW